MELKQLLRNALTAMEARLVQGRGRMEIPALSGAMDLLVRFQSGSLIPIPDDPRFDSLIRSEKRVAVSFFHLVGPQVDAYLFEALARVVECQGVRYLVRGYDDPVINRPLDAWFEESQGIELLVERPFVNPMNVYQDAKKALEGTDWEILDEAAYTLPEQRMYLQLSCPDLNGSVPLSHTGNSDSSLPAKLRVAQGDVYPFVRAYDNLINRGCCYANIGSIQLQKIFLSDFIHRYLTAGKSILIAAPTQDSIEELKGYIRELGYGDLLPELFLGQRGYHLDRAAMRLSALKAGELSSEDAERIERSDRAALSYLKEAGTMWGLGSIETGEDSLTGLNKFSYYHSLRRTSFALDPSFYKPQDFANDRAFFTKLKEYPFVLLSSLRDNPLHSYRANGSSDQVYQALQATLRKTAEDLDKLVAQLEKSGVSACSETPIDTLEAYAEVRAKISTVLRYDGFTMSFFDFAKDVEAVPLALRLNSAKQSTDQLFEEISEFVKDVNLLAKLPLKAAVEDLESSSWIRRWKAKRLLLSALRERRDYDSFVQSLREYIEETAELEQTMAEAEGEFGLLLYADNGPERILSSLEFVSDYERMVQQNPFLKRETNLFVARIFTDREFREQEREILRDLDYAIDTLKADATNLADFFSDTIVGEAIPFSEMKARLARRMSVTLGQFRQHMGYLQLVDESSYTIKQGLEAYDSQRLSLACFENDYWYSLYKSLALAHYRGGVADPYPALAAMKEALPALNRRRQRQTFLSVQERARKLWWGESGQRARVSLSMAPHAKSYQILEHYWDLALGISPLQIASYETTPTVSRAGYDVVLIIEPQRFDDIRLVQAVAKGERVLVVSTSDEVDARLAGFPRVQIDLESLYLGPLDYSLLSEDFMNLFALGFDENGYELETAEESHSAMPFSYVGRDGVRRCVIPYSLISQRQLNMTLIGTNSVLLSLGLSPLTLFPCMPLVIDPKGVVASIDELAERFDAGEYFKVSEEDEDPEK